MLPDESLVLALVRRARRRLVFLRIAEGATAGALAGSLLIALGAQPGAAVALIAVLTGAVLRGAAGERWTAGWWRSASQVAQRVERRAPARNLLVTAAELHERRATTGQVAELVMRRAAAVAEGLDLAAAFPAWRTGVAAVASGALLVALATGAAHPGVLRTRGDAVSAGPASISSVEVTVTPPAYSSRAAVTHHDPARIEALAGSVLRLRVVSSARDLQLETPEGVRRLDRDGGAFHAVMTADADGFIAIAPRDSAGTGGRTLIGLAVTPDRPPVVTLAAPGRDLFFSSVPDTLPVAIDADDDLALASLRLQYTAVSGSGERFTFVERDVPLAVSRSSERSWRARGTWRIGALGLEPGDLVVYRAIAADRRPGAPPVQSESYVLEVVTPGAIAAEGFAADDQRDRYAVSQQMVILKTERLIAARAAITTDSMAQASRLLAAEQRQVRAEFVFMMGGELEDAALETAGTLELNETAEAEAEGDLLAGRMQNQGRIDMLRAIRAMSRASALLTQASVTDALAAERAALDNLMRAFARSRFILRALTQRERIDLERRLTGGLDDARGFAWPEPAPAADPRVVALRRALAGVAALASDTSRAAMRRANDAALAALRVAPGSDSLQRLVARIQRLRAPRPAEVSAIVAALSRELSAMLPPSPVTVPSRSAQRLEGLWRDALARGRRP